MPTTKKTSGARWTLRKAAGAAFLLVATSIGSTAGALASTATTAEAAGPAIGDNDWLGVVNAYRAMSGLSPATENPTWSEHARAHSCYMLYNGITHDEIPGRRGYTPGGDLAGNNGNVAVSGSTAATPRDHIDLWMTGPFHAIGVLRPNLAKTGFGLCENSSTDWKSGATLDVLRGLTSSSAPSAPIVFPGRGATVALNRFVTETPNPQTMCNWSGAVGLPLIVMMPKPLAAGVTARLTGPKGDIEVCVLHSGNVSNPTARSILGGENAAIVLPRTILPEGSYRAAFSSSSGSVDWGFTVDLDAPLTGADPAPGTGPSGPESTFHGVDPFRLVDTRIGRGATRLAAGSTTRIDVADASVTAVSANFVAVDPAANGYLTAFNCTSDRPTVSNINYRTGSVIANQTVVPLKDGDLCLFTRSETDVVIDVNGFYRSGGGGDRLVPTAPTRLFDSQKSGAVRALRTVQIPVAGVPGDASAVSVNVTAIGAPDRGWLKVTPCGNAGNAQISSLNYVGREIRSNSAIVPIGANHSICLTTLRTMHVTIDLNGYLGSAGQLEFQPLRPTRLLDTRSTLDVLNPATNGKRLARGQVARLSVAGKRGIPSSARAVSINTAATDPTGQAVVTAVRCDRSPALGQLNVSTAQFTIANGAIAELSPSGELCLYISSPGHVIVDINGAWS